MYAFSGYHPEKFREIMTVRFNRVGVVKAVPDDPGGVASGIYDFPFDNIHKYQNSAYFIKIQARFLFMLDLLLQKPAKRKINYG